MGARRRLCPFNFVWLLAVGLPTIAHGDSPTARELVGYIREVREKPAP